LVHFLHSELTYDTNCLPNKKKKAVKDIQNNFSIFCC
jgi:hypothetical protein